MNKLARLLAVGAFVAVGLQCLPVCADSIQEISADSLDSTYTFTSSPITDSELRIEQSGVTVIIEKPGNVQEEISGAFFSVVTNLYADYSGGGKAVAVFVGGTVTIKDAVGVLLISADIASLAIEENTLLPFCVLAGAGTFDVTGGTWASSFGPEGILFDLTWKLDGNIDSFGESFTAESDVTLTPVPEPVTLALLSLGVPVLMRRRRQA